MDIGEVQINCELERIYYFRSNICHGKPCFKGTRIMASIILDCINIGMSDESIIEEYPSLTEHHIQAVIQYGEKLEKN